MPLSYSAFYNQVPCSQNKQKLIFSLNFFLRNQPHVKTWQNNALETLSFLLQFLHLPLKDKVVMINTRNMDLKQYVPTDAEKASKVRPPHTHTHTPPHTLMWHCYKSGWPSNNQNIHEWVLWNTNCEYKYLRKMCVIYSRTAWKGERRQESRVMGKLIAQIFEAWSDLFIELTLNSPTPSPITPAVIRRATHPPTQAGQEYILRTLHIREK